MITLVLGGTRSGKSAIAESLAASLAVSLGRPVTYIATAAVDPSDTNHVARVAAHQARRPRGWATVECETPAELPQALLDTTGVALVDSLGTWVTLHPDLHVDAEDLLDGLARRQHPTVVVSEEVGLAVHPPTELGRRYVDALGTLNQQVAAAAGRVLFVVAGRAVELPTFDPGDGSSC